MRAAINPINAAEMVFTMRNRNEVEGIFAELIFIHGFEIPDLFFEFFSFMIRIGMMMDFHIWLWFTICGLWLLFQFIIMPQFF